jgi:flavin reductase (DIM6/NTAB) family NADH-FMN oxidoreductase RutF
VAPVTIVTAGDDGMTASAIVVVEGDSPRVVLVISDAADFFSAVTSSGRFVVHICSAEHRALSDRFAEVSPSPGGLFHGLSVTPTEWGPRIEGFENWAGCRLENFLTVGYQALLIGAIDHLEVGPLDEPLTYFRGRYRKLA